MLTEIIKKELLKRAEDMEVNVYELDSCRYINNIYGVEPHLATGGYDWDENEEYKAKLMKLADCVEADGLYEYTDLADDEDMNGEMTLEAVNWLRNVGNC